MAFAERGAERRVEHLHRSPSGPISLKPSPFDFPQRPKRSWRIVGRWNVGGEFLVVIGGDEADLLERLEAALASYAQADLLAVDALWMERWFPGNRFEFPCWEPIREVSLRPFRFSRTMRLKKAHREFLPLPAPPRRHRKGIAS